MKRAAPYVIGICIALIAIIGVVNAIYAQEPNTTAGKVTNSSGNVANATATATIAANPGLMNYACGILVTGSGITTAAAPILATLTGINGGTMTFVIAPVAGVLLQQPELKVPFYPCQPATALNTAITLTVPAFGAGNTNATAAIWGYRLPY